MRALDGHQGRRIEGATSALVWAYLRGARRRSLQSAPAAPAATRPCLWTLRSPPPYPSLRAMDPSRQTRPLRILEQPGVAVIHRDQHLAETASRVGGLELVGTATVAVVVVVGGGVSWC